jgi:cubilin
MKVYDGDFDSGSLLETLCGYAQPNPIFSNGNLISIRTQYDNSSGSFGRGNYDIFYVASPKNKGQGCGGDFYNYGGYFTSPLYPSSNRTNYNCTWTITVPQNLKVAMKFGGKISCCVCKG